MQQGDFTPMWQTFSRSSAWRRRAPWLFAALLMVSLGASASSARAASGPFVDFKGSWTGTGLLQLSSGKKERIHCRARYRVRDSSGHDVDLELGCQSDSYKFDLTGEFIADGNDRITGSWTERSRNIGGTALGRAHGDRLQIHAESSALSADLIMITRRHRQSVSITSRGGGQVAQASITLRRSGG